MPADRRVPLTLGLLASLLLAGCATNPSPIGDAEAAHAGVDCALGSVVTGFAADGSPKCNPVRAPEAAAASPLAGFSCPKGRFVSGFGEDGKPACAAPPAAAPAGTAPATRTPTQEVASNLRVTGVYGVRQNATDEGLWDLKVNVELAAGAIPTDLTKLVIRYSDGTSTRNYAHDPAALPDGGAPSSSFNATWIRGQGGSFVMQSGDLVQLHFNLAGGGRLGTRTPVEISLVPETGSPVAADFKTPATFGTYTIVTLR